MTELATLLCTQCGSKEIVCIAPGDAGESFGELFSVSRQVPVTARCEACWPLAKREVV